MKNMEKLSFDVIGKTTDANKVWSSTILTLFPEMFPGPLGVSLAGKALIDEIWFLETINIRDFTNDGYHGTDDAPFGGGAGMVMRADVVDKALQSVSRIREFPIIYLTPRGRPLKQARVRELSDGEGVVILCGHYEGIDNMRVLSWSF